MTNTEIIEPKDKALITDAGEWFTNLSKWQKGCLIGCAVGVVFAILTVLGVQRYQMGALPWDWVLRFHSLPAALFNMILSLRPYIIADLATAISIVVVYGGYGAIMGKFQQLDNPHMRWTLTGFAVLFLLFIYWFNFQVAMLLESL